MNELSNITVYNKYQLYGNIDCRVKNVEVKLPHPSRESVHLYTYNAMLCSRIQSLLFRYTENRTQIYN